MASVAAGIVNSIKPSAAFNSGATSLVTLMPFGPRPASSPASRPITAEPGASAAPASVTPLVAAMARVYNEHHADNPVQKIDLVLQSVPLHPAANEAFPPCEQIKSFPISSARSN